MLEGEGKGREYSLNENHPQPMGLRSVGPKFSGEMKRNKW